MVLAKPAQCHVHDENGDFAIIDFVHTFYKNADADGHNAEGRQDDWGVCMRIRMLLVIDISRFSYSSAPKQVLWWPESTIKVPYWEKIVADDERASAWHHLGIMPIAEIYELRQSAISAHILLYMYETTISDLGAMIWCHGSRASFPRSPHEGPCNSTRLPLLVYSNYAWGLLRYCDNARSF